MAPSPGRFLRAALSLGAACILAAQGPAQDEHFTAFGDAADQLFGSAVALVGDVDGDGVPDLVVGADGDDTAGTDAGAAFLVSGVDGSVIHTIDGDTTLEELGSDVAGIGDIDGDGIPDAAVSEFRDSTLGFRTGRVHLISGATGATIQIIEGPELAAEFGSGVSGGGDFDLDGVPDILVGSHHSNLNGHHSGSATVVSGADGHFILVVPGLEADDDLGHDLAGPGDVTGDGVPDILGGAHDIPEAGSAALFDGVDGSVVWSWEGLSVLDFFGFKVGAPGDIDRDGVPDLMVGAQRDDTAGDAAGRAQLFSGATGAEIYHWEGDDAGDNFGGDLSGAGDWDGDGVLDLVVTAPGDDNAGGGSSSARIFSGLDGSILETIDGVSPGLRFEVFSAAAGDLDGDGRPELVLAFPYDDQAGADAGVVVVLKGAVAGWTDLGLGLAGALGEPRLLGQGTLSPGALGSLTLADAAPTAPTALFVSLFSMPTPFKGGTLVPLPVLVQVDLLTGIDGSLALPFAWPVGIPVGTELFFQSAVADAGAVKGVALSNALQATAK